MLKVFVLKSSAYYSGYVFCVTIFNHEAVVTSIDETDAVIQLTFRASFTTVDIPLGLDGV